MHEMRNRSAFLLVALGLLITLIAETPATAQSDVVLPLSMIGPPQGFVVSKTGINGPITSQNLARFSPQFSAAFDGLLKSNEAAGYGATWVSARGGSAVMMLFLLREDHLADVFYSAASQSVTASGRTPFDVVGVPTAVGFTEKHNSYLANEVVFRRGRIIGFAVIGSARTGQYEPADAVALAKRQYDALPAAVVQTSPSATSTANRIAYNLGQVVGALILVGLIVWIVAFFIRRVNRKRPAAAPVDLTTTTTTCAAGHRVSTSARFCPICGTEIPYPATTEASGPHAEAPEQK